MSNENNLNLQNGNKRKTSSLNKQKTSASHLKSKSGKKTYSQDEKKAVSFSSRQEKKSPTSNVDKLKSSSSNLIYLVRGKDQGKAAWHYVKVRDKAILPIFLKKADGGPIDVSEYGEILHSGWGENPPEDVVKDIEENYG